MRIRRCKTEVSERTRLHVRILLIWLVACGAPASTLPPLPATSPLARLESAKDLDGHVVGRTTASHTIVVTFASWCPHCHTELAVLATLRDRARIVGLNYRAHEEYDQRGSPRALRDYLAKHAPWLRTVPADEQLFTAFGRPPKIPTLYIFDARGTLVARYDRRERPLPDARELGAVLTPR